MSTRRDPILVDLALQGGGSHGAFTWGVLDRFLQEPWLKIEGISGTSAGAMNAAVLADGYARDGAEGARAALDEFWGRVAKAALYSPFRRSPLDVLMGRWTMDTSPLFLAADMAARLFSPYDLNPQGTNPLSEILAECLDFGDIRRGQIKLFITATNVRTGRGRIFRNSDLTPEVLLASACLPTMFQAVEIDGEPYCDGGYSGNPTITPLARECASRDTLLVQVNPVERGGTPRSAQPLLKIGGGRGALPAQVPSSAAASARFKGSAPASTAGRTVHQTEEGIRNGFDRLALRYRHPDFGGDAQGNGGRPSWRRPIW